MDSKIIKGMGRAETDAAFYYERGTWINTDSCISFEQTYKFTTSEDIMQVTFTDDRPFFAINTSSTINTFIHHCGQDIYKGSIKLLTSDTFYTYIVAHGPSINYSIKTLYKPKVKIPNTLLF